MHVFASVQTKLHSKRTKRSISKILKKRGYRQETIDESIRGIKFPDRQKTLASKPHAGGERLTFTTTYSPHLPTHHLRRLLVKHWHLIEKSPLLSRLFPNRPTVAFRTHKSIRKQLTRARLEDSKIVYKTRNVIYVIRCTRCKVQYAGMTTQPLHNRFSNHLREMFTKRPANWVQTRLYRHVQQNHHTPSDVQVQPVECTEDRRSLKKRESAWIKALRTIEPYGLNIIP